MRQFSKCDLCPAYTYIFPVPARDHTYLLCWDCKEEMAG